jgi:prepilin-type N-terminal cleavage/methylation domain-containing protein
MTIRNSNKRRAARGFSLMELLAVMSIMALLTTLAVTSYFGAVRGMTRRSAVKHFANTLILARQRACMENSRISVVVFNEITGFENDDVTPSYVICKELGRLTYIRDVNGVKNLVDEFSELDKMFGMANLGYAYRGSVKLYNLTQGKWSHVYPWVEQYPFKKNDGLSGRHSASGNPAMKAVEKSAGYTLNAFAFGINENVKNLNDADNKWEVGDSYGIEASPPGSLPRHFLFSELNKSVSEAITITFTPDGRAENNETIRIIETQPPNKISFVRVKTDGTIEYDERWK